MYIIYIYINTATELTKNVFKHGGRRHQQRSGRPRHAGALVSAHFRIPFDVGTCVHLVRAAGVEGPIFLHLPPEHVQQGIICFHR